MTRSKKIGLSLAAIAIIALGINYYFNPWPHTSLDPRFHPHVKPYPKKLLTIYGHVDKGLKVKLATFFIAKNPNCTHYTSFIEGASAAMDKLVIKNIQPNSNGTYSVRIALDKIRPGYCEWTPQSVYFSYTTEKNNFTEENPLISIAKTDNNTQQKKMTVHCIKYLKSKYIESDCSKQIANFKAIDPKKSSHVELNFNLKVKQNA